MAFANEKGLTHGDLKSDNLLQTRNDNYKLCDFGLSKLNSHVQTVNYKSPEMLMD